MQAQKKQNQAKPSQKQLPAVQLKFSLRCKRCHQPNGEHKAAYAAS
jgi:hypothetical protein